MAYAPSAIRSAATAITGGVGGAVFSGVVGDAAHSYGYHLARNQLPVSDYSVQLAADRDGNGDAASALDISLPPDQMVAVTARLRAAAQRNDPRLYALREFAGTLDGRTTFNRDLSNDGEGFGQWDSSHLWHIHLSGYRRYADDPDAWRAIADVFTDTAAFGGALSEEDDVTPEQWTYITVMNDKLDAIQMAAADTALRVRGGDPNIDSLQYLRMQNASLAGQVAALAQAAGGTVDMNVLAAAAERGAREALSDLTLVAKD